MLEKMEIEIQNVASGTYQMQMNNRVGGSIAYNADANSMRWNLDQFGFYGDGLVTL